MIARRQAGRRCARTPGATHVAQAIVLAVTMLATALAMGDAGTKQLIGLQIDSPLAYLTALALQLLVAAGVAAAVAAIVAAAGTLLRWARDEARTAQLRGAWQGIGTEAAVVGVLVAGVHLGSASREVYRSPARNSTVEVRRASRLESPLSLHPGSRGLAPSVVIFRSKRQTTARLGYVFSDVSERTHTVRFSRSGRRALVAFDGADLCLAWPQLNGLDLCPEPCVVRAFLLDEPMATLSRRCSEDEGEAEPEPPHGGDPPHPSITVAAPASDGRDVVDPTVEGVPHSATEDREAGSEDRSGRRWLS